MKASLLILAAALSAPLLATAADPVKFEVFLSGELKQSVSLAGPNSMYKFSPEGQAGTTLEFKLIAPEPLILEMKESVAGNAGSDVVGRVALIKAGSSVNVADIKGSQFRSPYVLVRGSD